MTAPDPRDLAVVADLGHQFTTAGGCSHPVRLRGKVTAVDRATGDTATVYDTAVSEPSGVLHVACGNRRESACPACSAIYKRDARQLVRAGLSGGKGVPESVAAHPCVFATFTAPSFGPVHSRRMRNGKVLPCRPRRDASKRACPHGRDISCPVRHSRRRSPPRPADVRRLLRLPQRGPVQRRRRVLWRRFTTYLPRHLARLAGLPDGLCRQLVKPVFVKVAEYQARGVVHFHAVIRLDANIRGRHRPARPRLDPRPA